MRSFLFVPGDSPRKFERAAAGAADALILDLEDSVAAAAKPAARHSVCAMLKQGAGAKALWVRINPLQGAAQGTLHRSPQDPLQGSPQDEWALDDLAAVMPAAPFGIVLPKSRRAEDVQRLAHYLDAFEAASGRPRGVTRILAIATELGEAMFGLAGYAAGLPRLWGLTWGAEDLAADLGVRTNREGGRYTEPFQLARSLCLYAAAAAGVRALDTVNVELDRPQAAGEEALAACRDGFSGKMAIHPAQVEPINAAFTPSAGDLDRARRIVAAFAAQPATGTLRLDGQMIDRPHLRAARRLLGLGD